MANSPWTLGPQERLLLLKTLTIADGLPAEGLVPLALHAVERPLATETIVVEQDGPLEAVLVVVEGQLTLTRNGRALSTVKRGEVAGVLDVLARAPSSAAITAAGHTLVLEIPAATLFEVYEDHFAMFTSALRNIASALLVERLALVQSVQLQPALDLSAGCDPDDLVERLVALRANPTFRNSRLESLARFAAELETFTATSGTRLWTRGDRAAWVLFLLRGEIRCAANGTQPFMQGSGAYVGAIEPFANEARWFDAEAATPVIGLRLGIERFVDLLEDDFVLASDLLAEIARGLREILNAKVVGM